MVRFCHIQHADLREDIHDYGATAHSKWSEVEYDRAAVIAEEKNATEFEEVEMTDDSDDSATEDKSDAENERDVDSDVENGSEGERPVKLFGIKHMCPLNSLQAFHSISGFPPDILHDVMEGVISEDLLGIIRILSSKNWFSIEEYNQTLQSLNYKGYEASDRPENLALSMRVKKLNGKAVSVWTHMRNFPFVIRNFVKDKDDSALDLGLKLHDITERLTASEFEDYEIDILEEKIVDYLDDRKKLHEDNPNLLGHPKPKTHFLSHYPMAIRLYGPPMAYWTARYESRHRIAKNTAEASKNFKNISLTVSTRQQMRQSSVIYRGMFSPSDLVILGKASYKKSLVGNTDFTSIISFMSESDFLCSEIELRSQVYKAGQQLVVLEMLSPDEIKVGLIVSILVRKESAYFITREFIARRNYLEIFQAQSTDPTLTLKDANKIVDYKPLLNQGTSTKVFFCLHHHISFSYP